MNNTNNLKFLIAFSMLLILLLSCRTLVKYIEAPPYNIPELVVPDQNEKRGIKLKILLPDYFTTILKKGSKEYDRLTYNTKNKNLFGRHFNMEDFYEYEWKTQIINNIGDYLIKRNNDYHTEYLILDKNNKPTKFNKSQEIKYTESIENCKYYIPDKIINIGDECQYDFTDIKPGSEYKKEDKKYSEISLNARFKLIGYTIYKNTRCALIESNIICNKADVLLYEKDKSYKKGGGMVYEISINNLIYLDYANERVIFAKTYIKNIAKGNYIEKWGDTPEDAISNIKKYYENFINENKTYCGQYFYNYIY